MVYARKGEIITCENGHPIGVFNRDVDKSETARVDQIDWLIDPAPKDGDPIGELHCQCGAAWARAPRWHSVQVFIGKEWRIL